MTLPSPIPVLWLVAAMAAGVVAHEATHYLAARALGRRAWVDVAAVDIVVELDTGSRIGDYVIMLAPLFIGVLVGDVLLSARVSVPWQFWGGWAVYTLGGIVGELWGGQSDLRPPVTTETP